MSMPPRGGRASWSCLVLLLAWSAQPALAERLSSALQDRTSVLADYAWAPGLVLTHSAAIDVQATQRTQLLMDLADGSPLNGLPPQARPGLRALLDRLPPRGRLVVKQADPRWLEVHPADDPPLEHAASLVMVSRPAWVMVLAADGAACTQPHRPGHGLRAYLAACRGDPDAAMVDVGWLIQPDGQVRSFRIADWNQELQEEPAPGAVIWAPDRQVAPPALFSQRLASYLATQGIDRWMQEARLQGQATDGWPLLQAQPAPSAAPDTAPELQPIALVNPLRSHYTGNDRGMTGLLQTPTARFNEAGEVRVSLMHALPYTHINVMLQPFDGVEAGFRYTDINGVLYGPSTLSGGQNYKDKSFDLRLRLAAELASTPAVALNLTDVTGTGLFSSQALVASKRWRSIDVSSGLAWGNAGARGSLPNPLAALNGTFNQPPSSRSGNSGQFDVRAMFRGRPAPFAGIDWTTGVPGLHVQVEWEGNDYRHEPFALNVKTRTPVNAGVVYDLLPGVQLHAGLERGTALQIGLAVQDNLANLHVPKYLAPPLPTSGARGSGAPAGATGAEVTDWSRTADDLQAQTLWPVQQIAREGDTLVVTFDDTNGVYWLGRIDRAIAVLHRDAPNSIEGFRLVFIEHGVDMTEHNVRRTAWVHHHQTYRMPGDTDRDAVATAPHALDVRLPLQSTDLLYQGGNRTLGFALGPVLQQNLGGPDGFLLYAAGATASAEWRLDPHTWLTGALNVRAIDNYALFRYDAPSNLPRVRTYLREYLTTARVTLPQLQFTRFAQLGQNWFGEVYAGALEAMYDGVGGELLYRPWHSQVAVALDVNRVVQRGFAQDLTRRDYAVTTGHLKLYWDTGWNQTRLELDAGQYLAGDRGLTLRASRQFDNGVEMGGWVTRTNANNTQYGEGSFDKGVFLNIPFDTVLPVYSPNLSHLVWQPLYRDGGAMLNRTTTLLGLTTGRSPGLLRWQEHGDDRRSQAERDLDVSTRDSPWPSFTATHQALRGLGRQALGSELLAGAAIVAGTSLLDRPVAHWMEQHPGGTAGRAGKLFSSLPYVLATGAGLLWTGAADNAFLSDTGWRSLQSAGLTTLLSLATKEAVGRARPDARLGTAHFRPLGSGAGNSSLPSTETAAAFALATPLAYDLGAPWLVPVAALTGIGRMQQDRHFLSDTVAGALLGTLVGSQFQRGMSDTSPRLRWTNLRAIELEWPLN